MNIQYGNPLTLGVTICEEQYNFAVKSFEQQISLLLFRGLKKEPEYTVVLDESYKTGDVFAVGISGVDLTDFCYAYLCGEAPVTDDYAKTLSGCGEFGILQEETHLVSRVCCSSFDWGESRRPELPFEDSIIYKLHVRGFTMNKNSHVKHRGTFAGIIEKIPYLKSLGITTLELMPAYEFDEVDRFEKKDMNKYVPSKIRRLNYWGYTGGRYFAPKASYCASYSEAGEELTDYTTELKQLVKTLHENGMELIMELYFTPESSYLIQDCIRFWVMEYQIDGVHIYCDQFRMKAAAADPVLSHIKIITDFWEDDLPAGPCRHMGNYITGFQGVAKCFLKGDENQLPALIHVIRSNPACGAAVNYITNHNGFTLADLVSYDRKHNEANGEDNRDGADMNHSWNCGVEGNSRRKKVAELRLRQMKNAFMILLTGQGTPLILAGDEFANSQEGNNNPYCIDSEMTWLDWKNTAMTRELTAFVREMVAFRKAHRILHMRHQLSVSDSMSCGFPDMSIHGENAWYSRLESYNRHLGIMYCSKYAGEEKKDELIYVAYNMHWERHKLALPNIPEHCRWQVALTSAAREQVTFEAYKSVEVPPRCVAVLVADITEHKRTKR